MRISSLVSEDLTRSLRSHQERILSASSHLETGLLRILDTPILSVHARAVSSLVREFNHTVSANTLLPLMQLEGARDDMNKFLEERLQAVCARHETRVVLGAVVERLTNLQSGIWRLAKSNKFSDVEVAIRVLVGLIGTQPLVVNYHSGVLKGVAGHLGLALPGVKDPPSSAPEGMLRSFIASLEKAVKKDDAGQAAGWSIQGGLHTSYAEDFTTRRVDDIPSVFKSFLLPGLIRDMDGLRLQQPAVPPRPRPRLTSEDLVNEFKQLNVEGARSLFSAVIEAARVHLDAKTMEEKQWRRWQPNKLRTVSVSNGNRLSCNNSSSCNSSSSSKSSNNSLNNLHPRL